MSMIFGNFSNSGERLALDVVVFRNIFEYLTNLQSKILQKERERENPKLGALEFLCALNVVFSSDV